MGTIINSKQSLHSFYGIIFIMMLSGIMGCSSSPQSTPDVAIPDLSAIAVDTPTPETVPVPEPKPEVGEPDPKPEEPLPEKPFEPLCVSNWNELPSLSPIPGVSNLSQMVASGTATFRATADGKMYKLQNASGGISIVTPEQGTHHINSICKLSSGHLVAQAAGPFGMKIDINIRSKGGKAYNIQFMNHNVDAEVVE